MPELSNGQPVALRAATHGDLATLSTLAMHTYSEAFGHSLSASDLAAHLENHLSARSFSRMLDDDVILVAEVGTRMIGYVQFGTAPAAPHLDQELRRMYVDPHFQKQGLGALLMDAALDHPRLKGARQIYLDVWEHNDGAQRFYARYGFVVIGSRQFAVQSGAETSLDLVMRRRQAESVAARSHRLT